MKPRESEYIHISAYLDGKRRYFTTGIKVMKMQWHKKHHVVNHENSSELNESLQNKVDELRKFEFDYKREAGEFTLQAFDGFVKKKAYPESFTGYFQYVIDNDKLDKATKDSYTATLNRVKEYRRLNTFDDVTEERIMSFNDYLRGLDEIKTQSTIHKHHKLIKAVINRAIRDKIFPANKNPYLFFRVKREDKKKERKFLNMEEINKIESLNLNNRLDRVRDLFIFCCYTGLSFIDLKTLSKSDLYQNNGDTYIVKHRGKTENEFIVLLIDKPLEILRKYNGWSDKYLLPALTNQKYNAYLKEIQDLAGIPKTLTTHVARHTFATTMLLDNQVDIETVQGALGHADLKTTKIYAELTFNKVAKGMSKLKNINSGNSGNPES